MLTRRRFVRAAEGCSGMHETVVGKSGKDAGFPEGKDVILACKKQAFNHDGGQEDG